MSDAWARALGQSFLPPKGRPGSHAVCSREIPFIKDSNIFEKLKSPLKTTMSQICDLLKLIYWDRDLLLNRTY